MRSWEWPDVGTVTGWAALTCAVATIPAAAIDVHRQVQVVRVPLALFVAGVVLGILSLTVSLVIAPRGSGRTPAQAALILSVIVLLSAVVLAGGGG